jgi:hypothetical protein
MIIAHRDLDDGGEVDFFAHRVIHVENYGSVAGRISLRLNGADYQVYICEVKFGFGKVPRREYILWEGRHLREAVAYANATFGSEDTVL